MTGSFLFENPLYRTIIISPADLKMALDNKEQEVL